MFDHTYRYPTFSTNLTASQTVDSSGGTVMCPSDKSLLKSST